jgi:hypothetical protein
MAVIWYTQSLIQTKLNVIYQNAVHFSCTVVGITVTVYCCNEFWDVICFLLGCYLAYEVF